MPVLEAAVGTLLVLAGAVRSKESNINLGDYECVDIYDKSTGQGRGRPRLPLVAKYARGYSVTGAALAFKRFVPIMRRT